MDIEKIKYINENINYISRSEICKHLGINRTELGIIIRYNNIKDERTYRYCPLCNDKVFYENKKQRIRNENTGRRCRKCDGLDKSKKYNGSGNPFFNKHHTDEMKKFYHEIHKGKSYSPDTEFKKGTLGNTTSNHDSWTKKYGKKIADQKHEAFKSKISTIFSGTGNPMYGKPAPIGSGNGWSGWYNGWYFRSLLELSYMIFIIERFNIGWESGENKKNRIEYIYEGEKRNYFPDFILNGKYMIECKPKKLWNTDINKTKMEYANRYCQTNNLIMKVRDCTKIKKHELIILYKEGKIKFIKKYELKINEMIS